MLALPKTIFIYVTVKLEVIPHRKIYSRMPQELIDEWAPSEQGRKISYLIRTLSVVSMSIQSFHGSV